MSFPEDQVEELRRVYPGARLAAEGGTTFLLLPQIELPGGVSPPRLDALLCPSPRDGYPSRLYYAEHPQGAPPQFQNVNPSQILGRTWYAASWRVREGLRLVQAVQAHLDALRHPRRP